jgi:hypothetical protein
VSPRRSLCRSSPRVAMLKAAQAWQTRRGVNGARMISFYPRGHELLKNCETALTLGPAESLIELGPITTPCEWRSDDTAAQLGRSFIK